MQLTKLESTMSDYENILVRTEGKVGVVQINRPQVRNALNSPTMQELVTALEAFEANENIGCMVVTGDDKAFAAGGDITQMATASVVDIMNTPFIGYWNRVRSLRKPLIAAVSGWCLGGGCELAMACDLIVASETAKFGQPEINVGIIPGAGGTQRLTRAVGKAIAMEMVLNSRQLTAAEALHYGLCNGVVPVEDYLAQAVALAAEIAERPAFALRAAKEAINQAFESTLTDGLFLERRLFALLFATEDQREGMAAFIEKRKPNWTGK
jgi:enoyl-CoA hydratase